MSTKAIREALDALPKASRHGGYPNEPIGGSNPYSRCCACKRSDPEISISGHLKSCEWMAGTNLRDRALAEVAAIEGAAKALAECSVEYIEPVTEAQANAAHDLMASIAKGAP